MSDQPKSDYPRREWWVIYRSPQSNAETKIWKEGKLELAPLLNEFREVAAAGQIEGRELISMWIKEPNSQHRKLIAYCGAPPPNNKEGGVVLETTHKIRMAMRDT